MTARSSTSATASERRRAGPALDRLPSRLREQPPLLRRLHRPQRRHARRRVPVANGERGRRAPRAAALRRASRTRTTTAASCSSARDGKLYVGMGDGGSAGDPENRAQTRASSSAKLLRIEPSAAPSDAGGSSGSGCAIPGASRSTARRRPLHRRRRPGTRGRRSTTGPRAASAASRTSAGTGFEGRRRATPTSRPRPGDARRARATSTATTAELLGHRRLRLPRRAVAAAVGRYFFGDYCTGDVWSLKIAGGRAAGRSARAVPPRPADLVRRGHRRRALSRDRQRPGLQARALVA